MRNIWTASSAMRETVRLLLIWLATVSLWTFLMFGWDKIMAKRKRRRVPEASLLGACLCGGAAGGLAGMLLFHHKIRKPRFSVTVPLLLLLQVSLTLWAQLR